MLCPLPQHVPGTASATPPALPAGASIASDRSYKLDLLESLPEPPQLLIFGDSRAQRFEPAQFQQLTGLRSFNAAFSNGRPLEAWAYTCWLLKRYAAAKIQCFWAVQPTTFYEKPVDPGLVQDARLARWFPQSLIDKAAAEQVATMGVPKPMLWYAAGYASDGHLLHNWYDDLAAGGRTLDEAIRQEVSLTLSKTIVPFHRKGWSRNESYMAKTLALFNARGVAPLLVMMPTQPLAVQLLGAAKWRAQHARFRASLEELHRFYRFTMLDFSTLSSFGGDPSGFYDGIHVRAENARLIAAAAIRLAPRAFSPASMPAPRPGW
jgi:hypothetical protein